MHIQLLSISARKIVLELLVLLPTFALQLSSGWSVRTEVRPVIYFHFNRPNFNPSETRSVATCIGPFLIGKDVRSHCGFNYNGASRCSNCYPHGCEQLTKSTNVTKQLNGPKGNRNLGKLVGRNGTLYVDLEVLTCSLISKLFLNKYAKSCEVDGWKNDANSLCPEYENETDKNETVTTVTYPITWPTTPSTRPIIISYSPQTNLSLTTQLYPTSPSKVGYRGDGNDSATNLGEPSPNPKKNYIVLWVSLAAAAIVFTLVGFTALLVQRSKIMKCLGNKSNRDILDNAFLYRDMSTSRRQNQVAPENAHYENIIPIVLHNETMCAELDLSVHNWNQEDRAAGENFPSEPALDIENQVNSVIYADLERY